LLIAGLAFAEAPLTGQSIDGMIPFCSGILAVLLLEVSSMLYLCVHRFRTVPGETPRIFTAYLETAFAAFAAVFLLCACPELQQNARAQTLLQLDVDVVDSEDAFHDGEYLESLRLVERAQGWLKKTDNRKRLYEQAQGDYQLKEALLHGLKAQVFIALENPSRAQSELKSAAKKLESRRVYYMQQGQDGSEFFLYLAFIQLLEGKLSMPVPDYLNNDDPNKKDLLSKYGEKIGNSNRAEKFFEIGLGILEEKLGLRLETPGKYRPARRCMMNLLVSMAKANVSRHGVQSSGAIKDAEALLVRAEELMQRDTVWNDYVKPGAFGVITYKDLQEITNKKKAGEVGVNINLADTGVKELKSLWSQTIDDWMLIQSTRAEVYAYAWQQKRDILSVDTLGTNAKWYVEKAEFSYKRAERTCSVQFNPEHPRFCDLMLSQARWFVTVGSPNENAPVNSSASFSHATLISYNRDCIFYVHRLRSVVDMEKKVGPRKVSNKLVGYDFLERKAMQNLLDLHEQKNCLSEEQVIEIQARMRALEKGILLAAGPIGN